MTQVSEPEVTLSILPANVAVPNASQQILVVAQKVSGGSAVAGELVQNILNDNSWDSLSGPNSQGAGVIRNLRKMNQETQVDGIFLDDNGSGVAATGSLVITGPAQDDGVLTVIIGSERDFSFDIAVADTDTADEIGDAIEAAILANVNCPITASNTTGTVTLTCDNDGTVGNSIGIEVNGSVENVAVAITAMSGGSLDPVLTGVFDVVGDKRYQTIIWPWSDVTELIIFLDARFNVINDVLDGFGVTAQTETLANLLSTTGALNSQSLIYLGDETTSTSIQEGPAQMEIPYAKAAQVGGLRALRLSTGSDISQFTITRNGSLDAFGGPALASMPYFNSSMPFLPITDVGLGFNKTEVGQLVDSGVSIIGNNDPRNAVILGEMVTTYKNDAAGNPDISFKFVNYVDTASNIREYFHNNLKGRFAQSRLTEGDVIRGRSISNASVVGGVLDGLYATLSGPDFVLTQAGEQALQFFKDNRTIDVDLSTGLVTITMKTPIVTQLREIIATMQIQFSLTA
jgi:phage tail sheath gpL-like